MSDTLRVVGVSGGKDSASVYTWAVKEFGKGGFRAVSAHTDNEHAITYNYIRNLHKWIDGPEVEFVYATFDDKLRARGLEPSGNRFLDMMLYKRRAPSRRAQFCTEEMKLKPQREWLESIRGDADVILYSGTRATESLIRAGYKEREYSKFYDAWIERPIHSWTTQDVFAYLAENGVPRNPLYDQGFERVGCAPCINSTKRDCALLPEAIWDKVRWFEKTMGSTFFTSGKVPGIKFNWVDDVREWSTTSRGGRQQDMFALVSNDVLTCPATWGACE